MRGEKKLPGSEPNLQEFLPGNGLLEFLLVFQFCNSSDENMKPKKFQNPQSRIFNHSYITGTGFPLFVALITRTVGFCYRFLSAAVLLLVFCSALRTTTKVAINKQS